MGIVLKNKEKGNKFIRFIKNIVEAGRIKIALLQKYKMRYSLTELPENIEGVNWYAYNGKQFIRTYVSCGSRMAKRLCLIKTINNIKYIIKI